MAQQKPAETRPNQAEQSPIRPGPALARPWPGPCPSVHRLVHPVPLQELSPVHAQQRCQVLDQQHVAVHPEATVVVQQHETSTGWWARATPLKNMNVNWDD